jgi:hypothetical protein
MSDDNTPTCKTEDAQLSLSILEMIENMSKSHPSGPYTSLMRCNGEGTSKPTTASLLNSGTLEFTWTGVTGPAAFPAPSCRPASNVSSNVVVNECRTNPSLTRVLFQEAIPQLAAARCKQLPVAQAVYHYELRVFKSKFRFILANPVLYMFNQCRMKHYLVLDQCSKLTILHLMYFVHVDLQNACRNEVTPPFARPRIPTLGVCGETTGGFQPISSPSAGIPSQWLPYVIDVIRPGSSAKPNFQGKMLGPPDEVTARSTWPESKLSPCVHPSDRRSQEVTLDIFTTHLSSYYMQRRSSHIPYSPIARSNLIPSRLKK